jgi:hypothetical protein
MLTNKTLKATVSSQNKLGKENIMLNAIQAIDYHVRASIASFLDLIIQALCKIADFIDPAPKNIIEFEEE